MRRRSRPLGIRRVAVAFVAAVALALVAAGCGAAEGAGSAAPGGRGAGADAGPVVLFGDSLSVEASGYLTQLLRPDHELRVVAFGGLALCDLADQIVAAAEDLSPAAVLVQFSGNALSTCMRPGGVTPDDGERLDRYGTDARRLLEAVAPTGTRVVFVGSPPLPDERDPAATTDAVFAGVVAEARASGQPVEYADAGAALSTFGGRWTDRLPCLAFETSAMGCDDGTIAVRSADGVHFCPGVRAADDGVVGPCPTWSSGAFRYAQSVADVVRGTLARTG